jgi:hypothetical protein
MTLWARADVSYVHVPVASGGCGKPHSRPVHNGKPAAEFILNCQGCENFLRADIARSGGNKKVRTVNGDYGMKLADRYLGLWGATSDTIPETPDEELAREHNEQAMITKNAASQTQTLAQIGAAVAGNAELMAKFIELQTQLSDARQPLAQLAPIPPVPVDEPALTVADSHPCKDCNLPIVRAEGQRGALPQRCPTCKSTHQANQRASYRKTAA